MNLKFNFHIIKPIQLPWEFISPTESGGLEYHLSPELSILIDGIVSGDGLFHVGQEMIALENVEVNEFQAEEIFTSEIMPNKSKERITKAFKDGRNSCFFTSRQMASFQHLFGERNFMSHNVSVYFKGRKVDDVAYLAPKEYKTVMNVFDELEVLMHIDGKASQSEFNEMYEKSIKDNAGRLGDRSKQNANEKLKDKRFLKRIAMGIGAVMIGIGALLGRKKLSEGEGVGAAIAVILIGTIGVLMEAIGRQEIQNCVREFRMD